MSETAQTTLTLAHDMPYRNTFVVKNDDGNPGNLMGISFLGEIRLHKNSPDVISNFAFEVSDEENGQVSFSLTTKQVELIADGSYYEIRIVKDSIASKFIEGDIINPSGPPRPNTLNLDTPDQTLMDFTDEGRTQGSVEHHTWYRGENCHFNPEKTAMFNPDAHMQILSGWVPDEPIMDRGTAVTAFGSCFAGHISKWLDKRDFNVLVKKDGEYSQCYVVQSGEGIMNSFSLRQQFEWAWAGKQFEEELWHGYDATSYAYDENIRQQTAEIFDKTDVFILTLGLSEVWYDEVTGEVFWRAVPQNKFDPSRHKFRVATFAETKDNLQTIYKLIRKHRPAAKIILTLSPIPLIATFRPVSCISANTVSKAIIRAALDEFMREIEEEGTVYYWPSYDIIHEMFTDPWIDDRRHIREPILDYIMSLFETFWCDESTLKPSLREMWLSAHASLSSEPSSELLLAMNSHDFSVAERELTELFAVGKITEVTRILFWADRLSTDDTVVKQWRDATIAKIAEAQQARA